MDKMQGVYATIYGGFATKFIYTVSIWTAENYSGTLCVK